jgi:hypothetical protein
MGVEELERRSISVTEPQNAADLGEPRDGRIQRQPRQAPAIIPISTTVSQKSTQKNNHARRFR